jgi:hypothetical protein
MFVISIRGSGQHSSAPAARRRHKRKRKSISDPGRRWNGNSGGLSDELIVG